MVALALLLVSPSIGIDLRERALYLRAERNGTVTEQVVLENVLDPRLAEFTSRGIRYALVSGVFQKREYLLYKVTPTQISQIATFTTDNGVDVEHSGSQAFLFVRVSPYELGAEKGEVFAEKYQVSNGNVVADGFWRRESSTWVRM